MNNILTLMLFSWLAMHTEGPMSGVLEDHGGGLRSGYEIKPDGVDVVIVLKLFLKY